MGGGPPNFYIVNKEIRGSDMQIVKLLSKKLGFRYHVMNDPRMTGEQAIELVKYRYSLVRVKHMELRHKSV